MAILRRGQIRLVTKHTQLTNQSNNVLYMFLSPWNVKSAAPRRSPRPSRAAPVRLTGKGGFPNPADDHIEGKLDLNEHLVRRPAATFFVRAAGEVSHDAIIHARRIL